MWVGHRKTEELRITEQRARREVLGRQGRTEDILMINATKVLSKHHTDTILFKTVRLVLIHIHLIVLNTIMFGIVF